MIARGVDVALGTGCDVAAGTAMVAVGIAVGLTCVVVGSAAEHPTAKVINTANKIAIVADLTFTNSRV